MSPSPNGSMFTGPLPNWVAAFSLTNVAISFVVKTLLFLIQYLEKITFPCINKEISG
jgi:hypothetical protein